MRGRKFWLPVVISLVATPICLLMGIGSAGAGHGDYFLARILFPFTMLSAIIFDSITIPFLALAVAQFPIYGILLGRASVKSRLLPAAAAILITHALFVAACLFVPSGYFS
jgi:hypothetical protein